MTQRHKKKLFLLKNGKPGAISKATYKSLVEDTFKAWRTYIRETARSNTELLDMCPYLGKEEHVSDIKNYPVISNFNQYFEINKG